MQNIFYIKTCTYILKKLITHNSQLITFLPIFAANFGLTSGEIRECYSESIL